MTQQLAATFFEEQEDGLGVLAVIDNEDSFDYRSYKSTDPHWQTLYGFLNRVWTDSYRIVVHGRASTGGGVNRENAHPIRMDCSECDAQYVVHNGSVRKHRNLRSQLTRRDHELNTPVDSEIIGHKVGSIPESIDDHTRNTYAFTGNLNYLVFAEDGILVRVSSKYHLADDFTMTCRPDELDDFEEGNDTEWMKVSPGGELETKERRSYSTSSSSTSSGNYGWGAYRDNSRTGDDTYTVEYDDLIPDIDGVVAIRVSPRDIKLINERDEDAGVAYINRDKHPEEFYYYANESEPDNLEQLAEIANSEQSSLDEIAEEAQERKEAGQEEGEPLVPLDDVTGKEREEAAEAAERAVVAQVAKEQEVTLEEAADIAEGVANIFGEA